MSGAGALRDAVLRSRRGVDAAVDAADAQDVADDGLDAELGAGLLPAAAAEDGPRFDDDDDDVGGGVGANEDVPAYLLELLQNHRNRQHLEEDFVQDFAHHDDYRERYDGFDTPPPFRQRHKLPKVKPPARARDLEISEEEAFSTRVFVTTPRRQR